MMPGAAPRRGTAKLACPSCGNVLGIRYPDGHVVSRWKGRTIRTELGIIWCEECDASIEVRSDLAKNLPVVA